MKQIEQIISKLKSGTVSNNGKQQTFAVTITDADTYKTVCNSKTGSQMIDEYGSVEAFFNSLFDNGHANIAIQQRRRNGSSWRDDGQPITLPLNPKSEKVTVHEATPVATNTGASQNPLFGLMAGMNGLDMAYRFQDYPKVETERDRLRQEVDALKEKVADLKEELLKKDYSENKASGNKELITELIGAIPGVMGALAAKNSAATGLNGTGSEEGLSQNKIALIQAIKSQSDTIAYYLGITLKGMIENKEFSTELFNLLENYKLTENNGTD